MDLIREATGRLEAAGIEDARLEADVLLAFYFDIARSDVYGILSGDIIPEVRDEYLDLVERRLGHEPLAYITGTREFYSLDFVCRPGALIPRPETEMLVDFGVGRCSGWRDDVRAVADIGSGTGAIAVALAANAPNANIIATDASPAALEIARENVRAHMLEHRIEVRQADLLDGLPRFDLILANLPYVAEDEWPTLMPEVRDYEPRTSLVGGVEGTEAIASLIKLAPAHLNPEGAIALEIGATQGAALLEVAGHAFPRASAYVERDYAGHDRMLVIDTWRPRDA